MSERNQPIPRPRKRCFLGNRPNIIKGRNAHRGRRVRRATSCAVKRCSQAGKRSFTHGERTTPRAGEGARSFNPSSSEFINDLHVWFRSFRVKLSHLRASCSPRKRNASQVSRKIQRKWTICIRRLFGARGISSGDRGAARAALCLNAAMTHNAGPPNSGTSGVVTVRE
jgi:hypothetical protein